MKVAIIGAGQRGMLYASYMYDKGVEIAAIVEPLDERRNLACSKFGIAAEAAFSKLEDFTALGKICDACVVATMDRDHYAHALALLDLGYDILLEKPISPSSDECIAIMDKAHEMNCEVLVCHVLRYTNFFSEIKRIASSGDLGKIVTIEYAEYMGNFHMAHSYVRGKWACEDESSPIILQKSCHDMDILVWLTDSRAEKVSSFGSLTYFTEANAPEGSTAYCKDCPAADSCRFAAEKVYLPMVGEWRSVDVTDKNTIESMRAAIQDGPYGRCVFRCDNDVCDHQVTLVEFNNGVTASFQMSAFSDKIHRRIKVMCEHGSIEGDDSENYITVTRYGSYSEVPTEPEIIELPAYIGRHGGGDYGIVEEFLRIIGKRLKHSDLDICDTYDGISSIEKSIESHLIANAAEEARLSGRVIHVHG